MQRTDHRLPGPRHAAARARRATRWHRRGRSGTPADPVAARRSPRGGDPAQRPNTAPPKPRSRGRVLLRRARRIAFWTLCAALGVVLTTAGRVWWVARHDARPTVDAILVLGASQYDGRPSPVLLARLEHALDLYLDGVAPRIITVGGNQPGDRFTEAGTGKRWLVGREVADANVLSVPEGRDTLQSVRAVAAVMRRNHWHSTVIVTDPWHALRSRSIARAAGLNASTSPVREGPAVASRSTQAKYVARETAAYLHWWIFRRSSGFGYGVV
ncbi:YdcF family protein [Yinghuangia seranimata]|uniref:YdcF family protein n=1 Tax=Yinghuangia seranimata TaxID=408067 RepID=UPI00248BE7AE|nr:YdcF family protein [Yinghuangia seranimata]MDI2129259.1 YdcF family protein [Yinghuangia seranimata]